jgi:hypothetical protein
MGRRRSVHHVARLRRRGFILLPHPGDPTGRPKLTT